MFYQALLFVLTSLLMGVTPLQAEADPNYNRVHLTVTAEREIVPDLMRITLYSEARDKNAARLSAATTKILNRAIEQAKAVEGITVQSGSRSTYPIDDKKIITWQERAELHLESHDFSSLAALSADLVGDLKIASQHFLISRPRQKEVENLLLEEAVTAFRERAQRITQALGGKSYRIIVLNFDEKPQASPLMMARSMEMATSASHDAIPQIEAGVREVIVTAQGLIEIAME